MVDRNQGVKASSDIQEFVFVKFCQWATQGSNPPEGKRSMVLC